MRSKSRWPLGFSFIVAILWSPTLSWARVPPAENALPNPRTAPASPASAPVCLIGSENETVLRDRIAGRGHTAEASEFLAHFQRSSYQRQVPTQVAALNSPENCELDFRYSPSVPPQVVRTVMNTASALAPQRFVRSQCIQRAMMRLPNVAGVDYYDCETDSSMPREIRRLPCVTPEMVAYTHFTVNEAINCLSQPGSPIDAQLLFRKINNESAFAGFIRNQNGTGIGQLVSMGAREMGPGGRGHIFLRERMQKRGRACERFAAVASRELELTPPNSQGERSVRTCQLVGMGNGMARNMLYSIGLFLYYREAMPHNAEQLLHQAGLGDHPDFLRMRDLLTMVAYSREGPQGMRLAMRQLRGRLNPRMSFTSFQAILEGHVPYLDETQRRFEDVFGEEDVDCTESARRL